jgi:hypothetical protein
VTEDAPYVPPLTPEDWLKLRQEERAKSIEAVVKDTAGTANLERALIPYQQRTVLLCEAGTSVLVIEKSRRIGLTWGLASYAVLRAAAGARPRAWTSCTFPIRRR